MKLRNSFVKLAAFLGLALSLPALMAPTGGGVVQSHGTFTATETSGCTVGTPTITGVWTLTGRVVTIHVVSTTTTCTSVATSIVFSSLPANIVPATQHYAFADVIVNGTSVVSLAGIAASGTLTAFANLNGGGYSGTVNGFNQSDFTYTKD